MKIAFFSNFLNHHQLSLCQEFLKQKDIDFVFVATERIDTERLNMGYEDMNSLPFVMRAYEGENGERQAKFIAETYDVVIFGAAPIRFLKHRMSNDKLTFRFCERPLKKGVWRRFIPKTKKRINDTYIRYKDMQFYILGASAFTSYDLTTCGFDKQKCLKWGYFPKLNPIDVDALLKEKSKNSKTEILYAGRLIKLKRVIDSLKAICLLVKQGISNFHFTIIGDGEQKKTLQAYVQKNNLNEYVSFLPFMSPDKVRRYMDKADIYIFGSNFQEGWGAVVNEAMNSACAVIVSHAVGSSAYLVKQGVNGFIFKCGDIKDLTSKLKVLINDDELRYDIGRKAYYTLKELWNPETATSRLLELCKTGRVNPIDIYKEGPCSQAEIIKNNWIEGSK